MITLIIFSIIKENRWLKYKLWCAENNIDYISCGAKQLYKQRKLLKLK